MLSNLRKWVACFVLLCIELATVIRWICATSEHRSVNKHTTHYRLQNEVPKKVKSSVLLQHSHGLLYAYESTTTCVCVDKCERKKCPNVEMDRNREEEEKKIVDLRIAQLAKEKCSEHFADPLEYKCIRLIEVFRTYPILLGHNCTLVPSLIEFMDFTICNNLTVWMPFHFSFFFLASKFHSGSVFRKSHRLVSECVDVWMKWIWIECVCVRVKYKFMISIWPSFWGAYDSKSYIEFCINCIWLKALLYAAWNRVDTSDARTRD